MTLISTTASEDFGSTKERLANVISSYKNLENSVNRADLRGKGVWYQCIKSLIDVCNKEDWFEDSVEAWPDILEEVLGEVDSLAVQFPVLKNIRFLFEQVMPTYSTKEDPRLTMQVEYKEPGSEVKLLRDVKVDSHVHVVATIEYFEKGNPEAQKRVVDLSEIPKTETGSVREEFCTKGREWKSFDTQFMSTLFMGLESLIRMLEDFNKLVRRENAKNKAELKMAAAKKGGKWETASAKEKKDIKDTVSGHKQTVRRCTRLILKGMEMALKKKHAVGALGAIYSEVWPDEAQPDAETKGSNEELLAVKRLHAIDLMKHMTGPWSIDDALESKEETIVNFVKKMDKWFNTNPECRDWEKLIELISEIDLDDDASSLLIPGGYLGQLAKKIRQEESNVYAGRAWDDDGLNVDPDSEEGKKLAEMQASANDAEEKAKKARAKRAEERKRKRAAKAEKVNSSITSEM